MKCNPTHIRFKCCLNALQFRYNLSSCVYSFFQREIYIIWNYKTPVTALMPYQFSVLSERQNVNPTFHEDTSKEYSKRILFSIYKPNLFFCYFLYCNVRYKSYPASKGLAQMIYLIFPLMPCVLWDHMLYPLQHATTACHQHDTPQFRNTRAAQDMPWEAETFNLDRDDKLMCSVPFHRPLIVQTQDTMMLYRVRQKDCSSWGLNFWHRLWM